ncbi:MAG: SIR2 family protein [Phycisphaerales bacterium]|nr:SIR2 family protein [Phycisphaerales bacterium]
MKLDPMVSIALSLHQHPGRYALLLGSGVSRSAQIPTGWDITLELIQLWASAIGEGDQCKIDPESWYRDHTGESPDYSKIIAELASTEHERQSLLRQYFEPGSEEQLEQGIRVPTAAHRAIARLAKAGTIKVVVTLNFDRLLEDAMVAENLHPNVISSDADAQGMVPLNHGELTIIKLHGDYRDTRLRNTPNELGSYPEALQSVLDEVLERYGLIVCGWSADWDEGLRDSIRRMTRHRYQTYWMAHGTPSSHADSVISHRDATVAAISIADDAFVNLAEKVSALDSGIETDPLTPMMALQAAKRYVSESRFDIQYHDLLLGEASRVREASGPDKLPWHHGQTNEEVYRGFARQTKVMETITSRLIPVISTGVYHGDERLDYLWPRLLVMLGKQRTSPGTFQRPFRSLSLYPAVMCLYAVGICAVARQRFDLLRAILMDTKYSIDSHKVPDYLCAQLSAQDAFDHEVAQSLHWDTADDWVKKPKKHTPGSIHLNTIMWKFLEPILLDRDLYEQSFDELEVTIGICTASIGERVRYGQFYWKSDATKSIGTREDPESLANNLVAAGFFDRNKLFDCWDRILIDCRHRW